MAGSKVPGPLCTIASPPKVLADGTLCRCASPLPGTVGAEPSASNQFVWGTKAGGYLAAEGWFQDRYPNLLEDARLSLIAATNQWILDNWIAGVAGDPKKRIAVYARKTLYGSRNDDRFALCGDKPQTPQEADQVLGSFAIDIKSGFTIVKSIELVGSVKTEVFSWTSTMYVEDSLGLEPSNNVVVLAGKIGLDSVLLSLAPSRKATLGKWAIEGRGRTYVIVKGDTLSKLAVRLYSDMSRWRELYDLNKAVLSSPDSLVVGVRLLLPER